MQYKDNVSIMKYVVIGLVAFAITTILILIVQFKDTLFFNKEDEIIYHDKTRKVAYVDGALHGEVVNSDGIVWYKDEDTTTKLLMSVDYFNTKESLDLTDAVVLGSYEVNENNIVIPTSVGMKEDIPMTYLSDNTKSANYIATMNSIGWETNSYFCDSMHCEYYLTNESSIVRLIISNTSLKLIEDVSGVTQTLESFFSN